jgi:RND family efflux transporter MFP subunit
MQRHGNQIFRSAASGTLSGALSGALLAAIVTLGAAASGCGDAGETGKAETSVEVKILTLGERDVALAESARLESGVPISGTLDPSETADVKAEISGIINGLRADAGSPVSRGQVLGTVTAEGIRSQAASAQAGIQAAEANLALARQRMESMKSLFETGAVAKLEYDNSRTAVEAAQAQVAAARAQATGARELVGRASVNSPLGGTVSQRLVNNGEAVSPGQKLFTIVNASTLELAGKIPASERGNISVGQPVALTLSADPTRPVRGTIARIEPVADLQRGAARLWMCRWRARS